MNKLSRVLTSRAQVGARLILSFGVLIAIVFLLGLVGLTRLRADADLEAAIDARQVKAQLSRRALQLSNLNNRITMQVFLVDKESEVSSLLEQRATNTDKISALIETLSGKIESSEERSLLDAIDRNRIAYVESYKQALHLLLNEKNLLAARRVMVQETLPKLLSYHAAWNAYVSYQSDHVDQLQTKARSSYVELRGEALVLISLAVVLSIAIAFFVTRNVTSHISRGQQAEIAWRQARDESEIRVQERTAELAAKNEQLKQEIAARGEIEDELRGSEQHYRLLFESNPQPMWVFDEETLVFLAVNDAAVEKYGYSRAEFLSMTMEDLRPTKDLALYQQKANRSDGVRSYDPSIARRHRTKAGSVMAVEITWHALSFSGRPAKLVLAQDITERKRAAEEILLQKARFQQLFDNAPLGMLRVDDNDLVVDANKQFETIFQYSLDEMRGRPLNDIVLPYVARKEGAALSARALEGEIIDVEAVRRRKDGTLIPVHIYGLPIVLNHNPVGVFAIYRDLSESKRAQERISQLADIVESSSDAIIGTKLDGTITSWNRGARQLYGYEAEEMIGQSIAKLIPPENSDGTTAAQKTLQTGKSIILNETEHLTKDGRRIYVSLTISPIRNSSGEVVGASSIARDITERKRAEQDLAMEEARFHQLFDNAPMGIVHIDRDDTVVSSNKEFETIFGFSLDEVRGRHMKDLIVPTNQSEESEQLEALNKKGQIAERETLRRRKDGTLVPVQVYGVPILADGELAGVFAMYLDLTQRKRMEQERQIISEIIQGAINTADLDAFLKLVHDCIGKYLYAGNCFIALYDEDSQLMHFPFWVDQFDPCPKPRAVGVGFSSYVLRTGKPMLVSPEVTAEMYRRGEVQKSGSTSASWLGVPLRTPTRIIGVLVVQHYQEQNVYDQHDLEFLTSVGSQIAFAIERKRAETTLRETENQLRQSQKMESIGTLAGGIAHDFNNLMTVVTGYSELALRQVGTEDSLRSKLEEIKKAGERAASLTRQLLAFSRKQMLQPKILDLNAVLTGLGRMLTRVIGEQYDLRLELENSLGQIQADPVQIEQIVLNLAVNACDAMPTGGYLTIKTQNVSFDSRVCERRCVIEPGGYVMLSVSDNGFGMDAETQAHIFEPFFTTKEIAKGTGLGLSTVYGIVKQSGGSIWVYSEVDRGTTFKIYLPRKDTVIENTAPAAQLRSASRGSETILLVEDEEMVRELSKEILEQYGYSVITAANGKEGLAVCREFKGDIDLMITDVVMPQMSGRQLVESIGSFRPNTRVLFMSGFTDDAVVRHGVLDDGICFIQKPFSPEFLAVKAREVLDGNGVHK